MIRLKLNEIKVMNEDTGKFEKQFNVVETHNFLQWLFSGFGNSWINNEFKTKELAEKCIESFKKRYGEEVKVY